MILLVVTLLGSSGQYQYPVYLKVPNCAKAKLVPEQTTHDRAVSCKSSRPCCHINYGERDRRPPFPQAPVAIPF